MLKMGSITFNSRFEAVLSTLKNQQQNGECCDTIISLGKIQQAVHGCVLSVASPVIATSYKQWLVVKSPLKFMVNLAMPSNCNIKQKGLYEIAFHCLVDFCYGQEVTIPIEASKALCKLAKAVGIKDLVEGCQEALKEEHQPPAFEPKMPDELEEPEDTEDLPEDDVHPESSSTLSAAAPCSGEAALEGKPFDKSVVEIVRYKPGNCRPRRYLQDPRRHTKQEGGDTLALDTVANIRRLAAESRGRFERWMKAHQEELEASTDHTPRVPMPFRYDPSVKRIRRMYYCPLCSKQSAHVGTVQQHYLVNHTQHKVVCPHCQKTFVHQHALGVHMRAQHPKEGERKEYLCPSCGYTTKSMKLLRVHTLRHHTDQRFYCSEPGCGFAVVEKHKLKDHMRLKHSEERPHLCSDCGASFKLRSRLLKHERTHSRPHVCHHCGFRTFGQWELKTHVKKQHPEVNAFMVTSDEQMTSY